tara:strand:- start:15637 stop:16791 length:1155 start_codon:yes stop_codon:yes gene_type:complete
MGPLKGLRVIEMAGIGPGPFCAMMLTDMGAEVVRLDRADAVGSKEERDPKFEILNRGRPSIALDLKQPKAIATVLKMVEQADILIEGFRPGVMERLGLGPGDCEAVNPRLVYGRMTGWGQTGPMSQAAGHDINYIALSGALHSIGRPGEPPVPPLNLIGDFGGGSMYLLFGLLAALWERHQSGKGQVVDAAILDGAVSLSSFLFGAFARGAWSEERGTNLLDGGRPWYDSYETADGRHICIGPIEPKFYAQLINLLGLPEDTLPKQNDPQGWADLRQRFTSIFLTKTRDEWSQILEGTDACFAPVLSVTEASNHPQNVSRSNFIEVEGVTQPAPTPRFSRSECAAPVCGARAGQHTEKTLQDWGLSADEVGELLDEKVAVQAEG